MKETVKYMVIYFPFIFSMFFYVKNYKKKNKRKDFENKCELIFFILGLTGIQIVSLIFTIYYFLLIKNDIIKIYGRKQ